MQVKTIVERVRAAIDEVMANDSQFLSQSTDEANLTRIIKSNIGYALQYVIENAPLDKLDGSDLTQHSTVSIDGLVGTVEIPDDTLRIVEARLSSWAYNPTPAPDTSQVALMQSDTYAKGSWDRPVSILTYNGSKRVLKMYSAKTADDSLVFWYIKRPGNTAADTADDTDIAVADGLVAALVYQTAALTMTAFREEIAASLYAIAARYLSIEPTKEE